MLTFFYILRILCENVISPFLLILYEGGEGIYRDTADTKLELSDR